MVRDEPRRVVTDRPRRRDAHARTRSRRRTRRASGLAPWRGARAARRRPRSRTARRAPPRGRDRRGAPRPPHGCSAPRVSTRRAPKRASGQCAARACRHATSCAPESAPVGGARPVRRRERQVVLLRVLAHGPVRGEPRRQARHARAHLRDPGRRECPARRARRTRAPPRARAASYRASASAASHAGSVAVLAPVPQRPADLGRVRFRPPPVELREVQAAVDQHLHAARAARLPGPPRRVDPEVHALHEVLGGEQVVVRQEDDAALDLGAPDELDPLLGSAPGRAGRPGAPCRPSPSCTGRSRFERSRSSRSGSWRSRLGRL